MQMQLEQEMVLPGFYSDFNWTHQSTFAEDGKKKEVMSFFDGSMRQRQAVTRMNTDDYAVVLPTVYDYHGNASLQFLPVPVQDAGFRFYENGPSTPFEGGFGLSDYADDLVLQNGPSAVPSDNLTGEFYSPANTLTNRYRDLIPDAEGYPYTQNPLLKMTVQDAPLRTGGAGPEYQVNNGDKATRYFYSNVSQIELNRFFGTEVGFADHYQRVKIKDPNGQVTVSYLDQEGRTIVSAYAGTPPKDENGADRLLSPNSKEDPVTLNLDLLSAGNDLNPNYEVVCEYTFSVTDPEDSDREFTYALQAENFCYNFCDVTNDPFSPSERLHRV